MLSARCCKAALIAHLLLLFASACLASPATFKSSSTLKVIPSTPATGPVTVQTVSDGSPLNLPKLSAVNNTAAEFWFFAAVSPDLNASAVVTFFTSTGDGDTALGDAGSVDVVTLQLTFENGSSISTEVPASEAIFSSQGDNLSGNWKGAGYSFSCAEGSLSCEIQIQDSKNEIFGTISLSPTAPPHYPFSPVKPHQTLLVAPELGWENAIPGAIASASFNVNGSPLTFNGIGYQDHNWSPSPFLSIFSSYYWGFTQLGPYTLVWFQVFDLSGNEHISSYVAEDGVIIVAERGGSSVVPFGANDEFPPHVGDGDPSGFRIEVDLGHDKGTLEVVVSAEVVLLTLPGAFTRWISKAVGGIKGGKQFEAPAINEEFRLT